MTTSILQKIQLLPENKQQEVEDFVNFLAEKYLNKDDLFKGIETQRKQNSGRLSGKIQMTEDFNDTPKDFQDYI